MAAPIPPQTIIDQARDFDMVVTWLDPAGTPVDNTGMQASFSLAQDYGKPAVYTLTVGSGITLGGVDGKFTIHSTYTQNSVPEGTYVAELWVNTGSEHVSLMKGQLPVRSKVG